MHRIMESTEVLAALLADKCESIALPRFRPRLWRCIEKPLEYLH